MAIRSSLIYKIMLPVFLLVILLIVFFYFQKNINLTIIVLFFLFIILFFVLFFVYLRRILIKPIDKLITAMWKLSRGKFSVKIKDNSSREFNILFHSFNNMVFELNYLKDDYYEEKMKSHEIELNYLQSQIKPHFFLNSLNIIYNLSMLQDYENIAQMSLYLGSYFQYTINDERKLLTLAEELKHIENYLEIQCLRLPGKIDYKIETEEEYRSVLIPPLTIQPFVENSIIHGMNNRIDKFIIRIVIDININNCLEISIMDNGEGFPLEKLRCFQQRKFGNGGEHIGTWNVYKRLKLNFENKADIKFYNLDNGGAVVKIIIPFL